MTVSFRLLLVVCFLIGVPLAAQEIDVQRNGVSLVHDANDNVGSKIGFDEIRLTYIIENVGSAPLELTGSPTVVAWAPRNLNYVLDIPSPGTINPGETEDFELTLSANGHGSFALNLTIASNDPDTPEFVIRVRGSTGTKEKKDDKCSTAESTRPGALMLMAGVSGVALLLRRRLRAGAPSR
jgi:hypothetical protein